MNKSLILSKLKSHLGFKYDSELADFLDIAPNTLSTWKSRNTLDYDKIIEKCEFIDANWLITGKEPMLRDNAGSSVVKESRDVYVLKTDRILDTQKIPLYNAEKEIVDYLHIPNAPKCDGALMANGDSMYPLIKSGDILGYKIIEDLINDIYPEFMYILNINVAGDTFSTIKFIHKGQTDEYLKLVSENKHHQDKEVLISKILYVAQIKLLVRTY